MEAGVDQEGRVTQEEPREDALRKTVGDVSTESPNRDRNQRPAPKARSPLTTSARWNGRLLSSSTQNILNLFLLIIICQIFEPKFIKGKFGSLVPRFAKTSVRKSI